MGPRALSYEDVLTALHKKFEEKFHSKLLISTSDLTVQIWTDWVTISELRRSELVLVYLIQKEHFVKELNILRKKKYLPPKHPLLKLRPFVYKEVIRVGIRLGNALLPFDNKHPLL